MHWQSSALLLAVLVQPLVAFKEHDFRTCSQAAFCRRGRALATRASEASTSWKSPYSIDRNNIRYENDKASFRAPVQSELHPLIKFELEVRVHADGVARIRMDEVDGLRKRYDEAASWALIAEPVLKKAGGVKWKDSGRSLKAAYDNVELVIDYSPLKVTLFRDGREEMVLNGRGLLHMEHFRTKETKEVPEVDASTEGDAQKVIEAPVKPSAWFEGAEEDGYWDETFSSWTDTKPKGPESLSLDIDFPNHPHVYGIPQHASPLSLPTTTGPDPHYTDPYKLYNADVFEYLADSPVSLYGSIPLMHAHSVHSTVGVFNALASETWIDVYHPVADKSTATHWIAESGILDVFILPGPTPEAIFGQYARLTGTPALPAHWALGHHQCRWNYVSSDDVRTVSKRFDEEDIPMDVIWLDIEYAAEHKYFIWEDKTFPDPIDMTNDVAAVGRKMVVIIDPHLKRTDNYPVFKEAESRSLIVKKPNGDDYEGWCWSGSSAWVDFFNPSSWEWWRGLFSLTDLSVHNEGGWRWKDSTDSIFIWNDMNEPSVFNGPEITMPKDSVHYGGWEHRDVHNVNGMLFHNATSQALVHRNGPDAPPKRPFVLSRSFYAGSQRFGAIWTGDNLGTWEHMAVGIPMTLSDGIAGMTFSGADVGGFFGNPEPEMLVRWYSVGAFAPFFRAHAHIDTKRREPYLLDEPYKSMLRDILRLRYTLLPVWYTAFRESSVTGIPILRPHYVVFPKDPKGFAVDNQYYVGSSGLLVKPVTEAGVSEIDIYLAEDQVYYDYLDHEVYRGTSAGTSVKVPAPLGKTPLLIRGGSIIPTRARPRRSSPLMKKDPFTLTIALDKSGTSAKGELYLDDGETYSHEQGNLVWRGLTVAPASGKNSKKGSIVIRNVDLAAASPSGQGIVDGVAISSYNPLNEFAKEIESVGVERVTVLGLKGKPAKVSVVGGAELEWSFEKGEAASGKKGGKASVLTVKASGVKIVKDWELLVEF